MMAPIVAPLGCERRVMTVSCLVPPRVGPTAVLERFEILREPLRRAGFAWFAILRCDIFLGSSRLRQRQGAATTEAPQRPHGRRGEIPTGRVARRTRPTLTFRLKRKSSPFYNGIYFAHSDGLSGGLPRMSLDTLVRILAPQPNYRSRSFVVIRQPPIISRKFNLIVAMLLAEVRQHPVAARQNWRYA
jgi:hypothetical protein